MRPALRLLPVLATALGAGAAAAPVRAQHALTPYEAVGHVARFGAGLEQVRPDIEVADVGLADTAYVVMAMLYRSRNLRWLYPVRRDEPRRYAPGDHAIRVRALRGNGRFARAAEFGLRRAAYGACVDSLGGAAEAMRACRAWWLGPVADARPSDGWLSQRDAQVLVVSALPLDTARLRAALMDGRDSLPVGERLIRAFAGAGAWAAYVLYGESAAPLDYAPRYPAYSPPRPPAALR